MSSSVIQRSFSGGELAPALYARADQVKYQTGLKTCRNFKVMRHGGVTNRAGTYFVAEVSDSSQTARFIEFIFNDEQTYVLEFGDQYMRVHRQGLQLTEAAQAITAATAANPVVLTVAGHGYTTGDEVYVSGVGGMTQLNGRNFKVVVLTANTFSLQYMDSTAVDGTAFGAYTAGGSAERVYEIATPYAVAHLADIQFAQSGDVITLTHPSYLPRDLARTGHTSWALTLTPFAPDIDRPSGTTSTVGAAGTKEVRYRVTAVAEETFEESLPGYSTTVAITGATQANPVVVTAVAHGITNGEEVYIAGVGGMTQLNDRTYTVANVTANTMELSGVDGTGYGAYTAGGTVARAYARIINAVDPPTVAAPNVISWTAVAGAQEYNVYKAINGVYGFIGVAVGTSFSDTGYVPDTLDTPPKARNPFEGENNYPSTVTYYQQRRLFGNTNNDTEGVWASRTGHFKNFTTSSPLQDDDAITWRMAGKRVNAVRHLLEVGRLLVFTAGGEWTVDGDSAGILRPGQINPNQQGYNGAAKIAPIIIGNTAIYVQARGSIVRDLRYELNADGYEGRDLTVFSTHLFDGYQIVSWAYQQIPDSIVWAVRSDGILLGLTYLREHEVWGWHHHDTDGFIEWVCVVPEGDEDAVYLLVRRTIGGQTRRYVERMQSRRITDIAVDAFFVDCGLTYDGRNTTATTMTLSGGTNWTVDETLTLTASTAFFTADDVGNAINVRIGDDEVRLNILIVDTTAIVRGTPSMTVPAALRGVATTDWDKCVDTLGGLWHLEGKALAILADGNVIANGVDEPLYTVTNGEVTIGRPYAIIHAGLAFTADLETLDIDTPDGETLSDKRKNIKNVTLHVESSRGVWAGPDADHLYEWPQRQNENYGEPTALYTGKAEVPISSTWSDGGRVFVRQRDPLPLTILAAIPNGEVGG